MKNKIAKVLTKGLIFTFACSSILTIILLHIFYNQEASGHEGGLIIVLDLYGIVASLILTICSATVYLNIKDNIRNNPLNLLLSFFVAPLLFILVFAVNYTKDDIWQVYFIIAASFFLTHTIHYFKFIKMNFQ